MHTGPPLVELTIPCLDMGASAKFNGMQPIEYSLDEPPWAKASRDAGAKLLNDAAAFLI